MTAAMALLMSATGAGEASQYAGPVAEAKIAARKLLPFLAKYPPPDGSAVAFIGEAGRPSAAAQRDYAAACAIHEGGLARAADLAARAGAAGSLPSTPLRGEIAFQDVHFSYPTRPDAKVLQGVTFEVGQGRHVAIIGATGSGKSTIAALINGFYPVKGGDILVDGRSYDSVPVEWLRAQIGYVAQEPCLFDVSVMENLRLAAPPGTADADIYAACRAASIHDTILSLPGGYAASVGPYGGRLSGGQRQRLAIARALVRDPKILILDEATAALDATSEAAVQGAIDGIIRDREVTAVTIAHRLSAIRTASYVLVLEDGVVVEQGTIDALLEADGAFAARWRAFHATP